MPTKPKDVLSHRINRDLSEKNAPGLLRFVVYEIRHCLEIVLSYGN